jgi:guanine deaminase
LYWPAKGGSIEMKTHEQWMNEAIRLAVHNVERGGGPFAALVVREDVIVGQGVNAVHLQSDPTAHAELLAIRQACTSLGTTDLSDCIVYASGEPCPMCMGAIYWAKPKAVWYACSKKEAAAAVHFPDPLENYWEEMKQPAEHRSIPLKKLSADNGLAPFQRWSEQSKPN